MSDDLRLNSIQRFRKRSDRLILEEHSSCEVPAGCGGVVLRWNRSDEGVPVTVRVAQLGESELRCGGELQTNGRFLLPFGASVLTLHLTERESDFDWLIVATRHHSASWRVAQREIPELSTANDSTWMVTTTQPTEQWTQVEFDDSSWQPMTISRMSVDALEDRQRWLFRTNDEAIPLALPPGKEVWVRKRYELHLEG